MGIDMKITGGLVATPGGLEQCDVLIADGRVAGLVSTNVAADVEARELDATGKVVLPGMIDVHAHTREPGYIHKEDIHTTSLQAAAGGVTTFFGMPNLNPATTSLETLEQVFALYREKSVVDWNHNPAATDVDEVRKMAQTEIRAFKIFMVVDTGRSYPHPAGTGMHDHGHLLQMMDEIAPTGKRFIIHPHDQALMTYFERAYLDRGENTPQAYAKACASRNGVMWDTAIDVILRLAEAASCPIHIAHMMTAHGVEAVRRAKARGVDVTCEVNHWTLYLSDWEAVERLGPYALAYWVPDAAREAVWQALQDGVIDMVSSDHAPHTREEKDIGWTRMWSSATGTPGIQYYYPLLLDSVARGEMTLERVVEVAAANPAAAFGLSAAKGAIAVGRDADIVVADLNAPWVVTDDDVLSRSGWTPYAGRELRARIVSTLVRGSYVFTDGRVVAAGGYGRMALAR